MTTRELRQMLFTVDNQEITVKELRAILFNVDEQDEELTENDLMRLTRKEEEMKND